MAITTSGRELEAAANTHHAIERSREGGAAITAWRALSTCSRSLSHHREEGRLDAATSEQPDRTWRI
ncbi:hypothetical protein CRG98_002680 [Punica granatum]|uniref:Uncharacterized protein n=1 Tax=Punica granatum TaxID=22663 RepID=A0A2I0L8C6_PUNGR|nr:hypothetical protein CRG98_002680 [Punica granatum]